MIYVNAKSLHARWFRFCAACWAKFGEGKAPGADGQTNLCAYFWTSIGAPVFIVAMHIGTAAWLFYVFVYFPAGEMPWTVYAMEIGAIFLSVVLWWGVHMAIRGYRGTRQAVTPPSKHSGIVALTGKYLLSVKHNICPLIEIGE